MSNLFLSVLRPLHFSRVLGLGVSMTLSSLPTAAIAESLSTGQFVFDHAPRLLQVSTTQHNAIAAGGFYEFKLTVPQNAGAPLQAVTISQTENPAQIKFATDQSQVLADGQNVSISAIGGQSSSDLTLSFAQPIQPDSTVTILLKVDRNAGTGGIYLFGVTAYPVGDSRNGLFLGYGRVTLYSQGG